VIGLTSRQGFKIDRFMTQNVRKENLLVIFIFASLVQVLLLMGPARAELRKVKVGDNMPEFSLSDSNGVTFIYKQGRGKVLTLAFLPTVQSRLERAIADIEAVVESLPERIETIDFAGVISGSSGKELLQSLSANSKLGFPVLLDSKYHLWGTLGVIAAPTVLIVGKDDKVVWIKAGYGYDFVPVVRSYVNQALGFTQETVPEDARQVKTVVNDTITARVKRHLQMAKMLEQKGRFESAVAEIRKAESLDPNSIEPAFELGELFCRIGKGKMALDTVKKIKATRRLDKARLLLISGWAKRQMSELEAAEKLLLEATTMNSKCTRAWFELGRIYQAWGQTDKAMKSYYKALELIFGVSENVTVSH